ncbi:hypothetical protein [Sorangium sp. So ce117]|uniref:hypothetical protein n=1 Tax=Sorangium sp. So ce117 TaxID=3133277 RepID=UPI003F614AB4
MKRWSAARVVALGCLAGSGCDAEITSVGAWAPVVSGSSFIEAELGELSDGFTVGEDSRASEGRFIAPPAGVTSDGTPGLARARYRFEAPSGAEYVIWGRIHAPSALNNRFWFQVDGGTWYLWRISVGDIWFWDDLHDNTSYGEPLRFPLSAGAHELVLANAVEGVGLDRLYFTPHGDEPPGNDTPCDPPHSIEIEGECLPSCGALKGTACGDVPCAGRELLEAYDCAVCCSIEGP